MMGDFRFAAARRASLVPAIAAVVLLATAGAAGAQGIVPPRAPQGLFGGILPDAGARVRLDVSASIVEGYDDDVPAEVQPVVDRSSLQSGGFSTFLTGAAAFAYRGSRAEVAANASSTVRYYGELGETRSVGHSAGVGVDARLSDRATLLLNQSVSYSPTYFYDLFPIGGVVEPGDAGTTTSDFTVSDRESTTYRTTASLRHEFSTRDRLTLGGEYEYTDRLSESDVWSDISGYTFRGGFSRDLARNTTLSTSGRYHSGHHGYIREGLTTELGADVGLEFRKPLSATRQTAVRFSVGLTGLDLPESRTAVPGDRRQYRTVGDVSYAFQFGRTWEARAGARRGVEYLADLPEPVFADSVSAGVDGLLSRRVDVAASAGYSNGESVLNRGGERFDTYSATAQLRVALGRSVATYVQYLYYYYDFRGTTQLLAGIPAALERQGVRVGLTVWAPALRR